jgi:hypothetical protein
VLKKQFPILPLQAHRAPFRAPPVQGAAHPTLARRRIGMRLVDSSVESVELR